MKTVTTGMKQQTQQTNPICEYRYKNYKWYI